MNTKTIAIATLTLAALAAGSTATRAQQRAVPAATAGPSATPLVEAPTGRWSLAEREYWQHLNEELEGYVRDARQNCGVDFTASYDHESFRGRMTEGGSYGLSAYDRNCVNVVQGIRDVCVQGAMQAAAVRASGIRRLVCSYGTPAYSIQGNVGRATFNDSKGGAEWLEEWRVYIRNHI